jgi:hypothetical protein
VAPPPEPAPRPTPPPEPTKKPPTLIIAAVVGVIAAAIGYVAAPSSTSTTPSTTSVALTESASSGPITLNYPKQWSQVPAPPAVATSLKLTNQIVLSAGASAAGGALVAGTTSAVNSSLLPNSLVLSSQNPGATVKLGGNEFKRYLNLVPQGASTAETVYSLPTSSGTVIASCVAANTNAAEFASTCEQAVGTIKLSSGTVVPLSANPAYASSLGAIVSTLNSAQSSDSAKLAGAKTRGEEASAASALAGAYSTAAAGAEKLTPGPTGASANASIVSAFKQLAGGYGALAGAAKSGNGGAYNAARATIDKGNTALSTAFDGLKAAGYSVG